MYEIWLALNIVYEIALSIWPALLLIVLVWLALLVGARQRLSARAFKQACVFGLLVAFMLAISLPALTQSAFSNMGYWVDWANLLAIAAGLGAAAALLMWPLAALLCPGNACRARS